MKIPLAREVLSNPEQTVRESDIVADCEQCGLEIPLSQCKTDVVGAERTYRCAKCNDLLLIIGVPGGETKLLGLGYRIGHAIFSPVVNIAFLAHGGRIGIPPSTHPIDHQGVAE
jgi:hypothetical protein